MKGKLIAIEGLDSSGKETQTELLYQSILEAGYSARKLSFPRYDSPSSALVKMYLERKFGQGPESVNAFAASSFYAVDRFASYQSDWKPFYQDGGIVLTDRYTGSNAIYQGSKLSGKAQKDYWEWLYDFEHVKMGLPEPDCVFYLDVPAKTVGKFLSKRKPKDDEIGTSDIYEKDISYLEKVRETALSLAKDSGWIVLSCCTNGKIRSIRDIHQQLKILALRFLHRKWISCLSPTVENCEPRRISIAEILQQNGFLLRRLGVDCDYVGFKEIQIAMIILHEMHTENPFPSLYKQVGKKLGISGCKAECNMRNLLLCIWKEGNRKQLNKLAFQELQKCPPLVDFLDILLFHLENKVVLS